MKIKLCGAIIFLLICQSCCLKNGEEISRVLIPVEDKAKIPYADNESISMITNEGFQFQLNTTLKNGFNSNQEHCEDYTSYEYYSAQLVSELPTLNIELRLQTYYDEINEEDYRYVDIMVNRLWFYHDFDQELESITINGTLYADVWKHTSSDISDPISEVLYNEANGLLKINYTNGDYVQINQ